MLFRVRLIINKVKEIFNKISLSFYSHQIKELNRSYLQKFLQFRQLPTEHSRNLYTKDCINYDEKRKKLDQQVDLYTQRLMNVRKRSERLQYELNAYKAIDFLRSLSGDQLESHLDVSKFLKDFSESLVNEEGQFDTKTIYLLQKYMGIAPHEYLNDDETVDVEKLMHATAEFLGLSEEDLVNQVKLNPIKVKYLKQKLPQSGLRTHSFSLVGQTLSTP